MNLNGDLLSCQELTKLDERIRPQGAADALPVVGDDELSLQLIQEAESQNIRVAGGAHHQVADAQGAGETGTHTLAPLRSNSRVKRGKHPLDFSPLLS